MSTCPPAHATDTAALSVEKVGLSATLRYTTETVDAGNRKNVAVREAHVGATATIATGGGTRSDVVDEASSDDETGISSASPSDITEHSDLPKETEDHDVFIVQHSTAHIERTQETISDSPSGELSIKPIIASGGDVEKPVDDLFDINSILRDMLQAGLQPRGGSNTPIATSKAKTDPMNAGRGTGKEDGGKIEKEKMVKQTQTETPKAGADKKAPSKSGKR